MQPMYRSLRKAVSCLVVLLLIFAISSSCSAATDTFTYDANGNMISGSGFSYEYNDANQLIQVINESDSSTVADYFYDSNGQRVKKIENGITTYYIGDYVETRVTGSTEETTSYYFANNERVARKDPDGLKYYYHGDHLGSTSVVSDENGALSEKVSYYPYGSLKERVGEGSTYLFTDQEFDDESGLYYYGARYYNPELTRFTQPDTITQDVYNPQNLNRYSYVLNNPLKYTDPTGHIIPLLFAAIVIGGVAAEVIYLSSTENPTLEGTLFHGWVGGTSAAVSGGASTYAASAGVGTAGVAVVSGVGSAGGQAFENVAYGEDVGKDVAESFVTGTVTSYAVGKASKDVSKLTGVHKVQNPGGKGFRYMIRGNLARSRSGKIYDNPGSFLRGANLGEAVTHEFVSEGVEYSMKTGLEEVAKLEPPEYTGYYPYGYGAGSYTDTEFTEEYLKKEGGI